MWGFYGGECVEKCDGIVFLTNKLKICLNVKIA